MGTAMKAPVPSSDVTVTVHGGARLAGALCIPPGAHGVVLFAHGSGSSRQSPRNLQVAEALQQASLATLLFDLLTGEEESDDRADGRYRFDIPRLAARLEGATQWAGEQEALHGLPAGYFGASTGAAAALIAAAGQGERVQAVVSRGGRPDLAGDALERVTAPTLFIVGSADTPVIALNRQAFARLPGDKELVLVPNATHLFEEVGAMETVTQFAVEWFGRHLVDAAAPPRPGERHFRRPAP